jgi:hypothetical protein
LMRRPAPTTSSIVDGADRTNPSTYPALRCDQAESGTASWAARARVCQSSRPGCVR